MLAINQKISEILMNFWGHLKSLVDPFLGNLDPSLFQNIILGILAIFIPFAIVFYTNILDSKKKRSEFEKMVLSDEVLGTKTIFWFSIFSIIFFSFFSGTDISINAKISAIIFLAISISILWKPFKKILIFSEGKKTEFEISFLKKFKLSRILTFSNNVKLEKIIRAWESFWSEKSGFNEGTFTKIFISHIDETIKHGKLNFTVQLAKTYNIHQRDTYLVGYEILPKILEWNERLWNKQQLWLEGRGIEKRIQKLLPEKQVPTFQKLALRIFKRIYEIEESFWNWNYFEQDIFGEIIKILLNNDSHQFFSHFKKHVDESEDKYRTIKEEKKKQKYWYYIIGIFKVFCINFFNNINKSDSRYTIWDHEFPSEWKITEKNFENNPSRIMLSEFLTWSRDRIFKKTDIDEYDDDLTEVIDGLFPNVHPTYFPDFLMLYTSFEIKTAINKQLNFFITGDSISWSGEKSDEEINEMLRLNDLSKKEETINIILKYFNNWKHINIFKDDLTPEEHLKWKDITKKERLEITNHIRVVKLTKLLDELNSEEIKKHCEELEAKEFRRKEFVELITLLISKIEA